MGQYYKPILTNKNGNRTLLNRTVNGVNVMAKLLEHAWCGNLLTGVITRKLYKSSYNVVWVGDYSGDTHPELHQFAWSKKSAGKSLSGNELALDNLYLINHTKRQFINCDDYIERSTDSDGDCIHPLPLLTAVGNGNGGGDYAGETGNEWIGAWANDLIEVDDNPPKGYTPVMPTFIDSGSEPTNIVDIAWDVDDDDVIDSAMELDDNEFKRTFGVDKTDADAENVVLAATHATEQAAGIILGLPTNVNAPAKIVSNKDSIADWLSDKYEFCVKSFKLA